jgi:hypothetical protein
MPIDDDNKVDGLHIRNALAPADIDAPGASQTGGDYKLGRHLSRTTMTFVDEAVCLLVSERDTGGRLGSPCAFTPHNFQLSPPA